MKTKKQKVLLGMSGGVDSSVAAVLLLEEGYEVIGAFMKNWSGDVHGPEVKDKDQVGEAFEECGWKAERRDAMRVAAALDIPFMTFDFEKEYRRDVVEYMFAEYKKGRTPNPDVMCNKFMKFDLFLREADALGCDFVATGHYARIDRTSDQIKILSGVDDNKDQTYFLWAINPDTLPRILFPLGHLHKPEVRKIAEKHNLIVADKKDSTGICFVGEVNMREFLQARIPQKPGKIVTTEGKVVGEHEGIFFYTIGQRQGLNIGGGEPYYVVEKNIEKNELVVTSNFHPALFKKELTADGCNWFHIPKTPFDCLARTRHRQDKQKCTIQSIEVDTVRVTFDTEQRAITPGQSIVFYDEDEMIGGAIIQ